jgi:hypothetical protein
MTTKRREASKRGTKKLKLKKETIRNLDVKGKGPKVKGGLRGTEFAACTLACTVFGACPQKI